MNPSPVKPAPQNGQSITQQWQGPLPPPAALESFERVIPGSADRILTMAEKEQGARIAHEKTALDASVLQLKRGQIYGVLILLAAIGGAILTAYFGAPWQVPCAIVGLPVISAVIVLITGRREVSKAG